MNWIDQIKQEYQKKKAESKVAATTGEQWELAMEAIGILWGCGINKYSDILGDGNRPDFTEPDRLVAKCHSACKLCGGEITGLSNDKCDRCHNFVAEIDGFLNETGLKGLRVLCRKIAKWCKK